MNDVGVIDRFTNVFSQYIDSGFGLLGQEVAFLTATLVAIDITLAGLFWAMGGTDDIIAKLVKKTLYVGAFAYIINNFNTLASILFRSFAGLGLTASGSTLTQAQLLQPGRLASVGIDSARPLMDVVGTLTGFPEVFANLDTIVVLLLAWVVVIASFFVLAVQMFVTLIEFKLTTLAGFVLVPFALWNKTAFLAERVLGNVISAGIKVLVLAVIVGIGTGIFRRVHCADSGRDHDRQCACDHARVPEHARPRHLRSWDCRRTRFRRSAARRWCRRGNGGWRRRSGGSSRGIGRECGTDDRVCRDHTRTERTPPRQPPIERIQRRLFSFQQSCFTSGVCSTQLGGSHEWHAAIEWHSSRRANPQVR